MARSELGIIGAVVAIQGFGSALTRAFGDGNWGLLAVAERWTPVPTWLGAAIGVAGLALVAAGFGLGRRRTG